MPDDLLFSSATDGPIEVEIVNPSSVVQLGVLREGDHHVGLSFRSASEQAEFVRKLVTPQAVNASALVMDGNRLTIRLPDVEGPGRNPAGIRLYVPAKSTVNYRSDSGRLAYQGSWNPRDDWWPHRDDDPAPPLYLTYEANKGKAQITGLTGSVNAFDRAGRIQVILHDGVGKARTSTGSIRASGTGTLSLHAEEPGSEILLSSPCDLDLTVDPRLGEARFGFQFEFGEPLRPGTYHAAAEFVTSRPPEGGRVVEKSELTVTPVRSSPPDATRAASAALAGPPESGRAAGELAAGLPRPAGRGTPLTQTQVNRQDGGQSI